MVEGILDCHSTGTKTHCCPLLETHSTEFCPHPHMVLRSLMIMQMFITVVTFWPEQHKDRGASNIVHFVKQKHFNLKECLFCYFLWQVKGFVTWLEILTTTRLTA